VVVLPRQPQGLQGMFMKFHTCVVSSVLFRPVFLEKINDFKTIGGEFNNVYGDLVKITIGSDNSSQYYFLSY
jgi:hypothetical protein